jgi:ribosomal protein L1
MLYNRIMKSQDKSVRQSISLPSGIARRVRILAEKRKASANRVLVDLIEAGLHSREAEKERFFALTNQLAESADPAERRRIKKELARMTFGAS